MYVFWEDSNKWVLYCILDFFSRNMENQNVRYSPRCFTSLKVSICVKWCHFEVQKQKMQKKWERFNISVAGVFFIVDTSAPVFDLNLPLYRQQLNKDLIMNIYIDGKWGSYRHLPLDSCATVTVPHAWVNIMTPGDLSSFRWLEGNLDPDRFVSVFCIKFWTLICTLIRLVNVDSVIKIL